MKEDNRAQAKFQAEINKFACLFVMKYFGHKDVEHERFIGVKYCGTVLDRKVSLEAAPKYQQC